MTEEHDYWVQSLRNQAAIMEVLKQAVVLQNRMMAEASLDLLNRRLRETTKLIGPIKAVADG